MIEIMKLIYLPAGHFRDGTDGTQRYADLFEQGRGWIEWIETFGGGISRRSRAGAHGRRPQDGTTAGMCMTLNNLNILHQN